LDVYSILCGDRISPSEKPVVDVYLLETKTAGCCREEGNNVNGYYLPFYKLYRRSFPLYTGTLSLWLLVVYV